ncbi:MAG: RsmD family RNA methyltransferase [Candidatus Calescibacterium sp.]|jgi:16S rRNA (guanine(966)-N(2))-methyltransferase RsmD
MGKIKVSGGELKGRNFKVIGAARPLTSLIKKAIFDSIDVSGKTILDLFAGSGSFGIEALSRGAEFVFFVESNLKIAENLKKNIRELGIEKKSKVVCQDVIKFLKRNNQKFDIVFADPPFSYKISEELIKLMKENSNYLVIVRRFKKNEDEKIFSSIFEKYEKRKYSDSVLLVGFSVI